MGPHDGHVAINYETPVVSDDLMAPLARCRSYMARLAAAH